jgi:hypothetical protein
MPRLVLEHFDPPSSTHAARVRSWASERAADELAGRHLWCAATSARGRSDARALRDRLLTRGGVAAEPLEVRAAESLRDVVRRLDAMLAGLLDAQASAAAAALCAEAAAGGEAALGRGVHAGDVVVVHDSATALAADAARARGAHVVWHMHVDEAGLPGSARLTLEFLRRYTSAVDAYVWTSSQRTRTGEVVHRVAAFMPGADVVTAKEIHGSDPHGELAWRTALADVVTDDRADHVGGRIHVRPTVAAR